MKQIKKQAREGRFYTTYTIEKSLRHHIIEWAASVVSITGALLVSLQYISGFYIFFIADILWASFAIKHRHWGLLVTSILFFIINIIGIISWAQ